MHVKKDKIGAVNTFKLSIAYLKLVLCKKIKKIIEILKKVLLFRMR